MYIKIKYSDVDEGTMSITKSVVLPEEREFLVNFECNIRLALEYIRSELTIEEEMEFDLCDESGTLKRINTAPPNAQVSELFKPKTVFYVVCLPKNEFGICVKPVFMVNKGPRVMTDLMNKVKKQLNQPSPKK